MGRWLHRAAWDSADPRNDKSPCVTLAVPPAGPLTKTIGMHRECVGIDLGHSLASPLERGSMPCFMRFSNDWSAVLKSFKLIYECLVYLRKN